MRVAILSAVNIRHMSLISLYTDILKKNNIDYDIIYMDKYNENEFFECNTKYRYINTVDRKAIKPIKALKYLMFIPYAKKIMTRNKYDFIIVWNDVAIFLFADILRKLYPQKYCLNVRDNMYYDVKWLNRRYAKSFKKAAFVTVSSKGFLDILPQGIDYIQINSINLAVLEGMNKHKGLRSEGKPIRIGFIGYVRFYERNCKILDAFANDTRFELHYYGTGSEVLEEYAKHNGILNTQFHGTFPLEDTRIYLEKIDIINNLYGNSDLNLRKAISIKLFHAIYSHIPILVCPNTYVGEVAQNLGMAFEVADCDITNSLPDRVFQWYRNLDFDQMVRLGLKYLNESFEENERFAELLCQQLKCAYNMENKRT